MNPFDDEARRLSASGKKIQAIKLVPERTGIGLAEAKAYVEALDAGQVPTVSSPGRFPTPTISAAPITPQSQARSGGVPILWVIVLVIGAVLITIAVMSSR